MLVFTGAAISELVLVAEYAAQLEVGLELRRGTERTEVRLGESTWQPLSFVADAVTRYRLLRSADAPSRPLTPEPSLPWDDPEHDALADVRDAPGFQAVWDLTSGQGRD